MKSKILGLPIIFPIVVIIVMVIVIWKIVTLCERLFPKIEDVIPYELFIDV